MDAGRLKTALGEVIREKRLKLGHSQDGFAAEIGLHRTYMGGIERGERNVSLENLNVVAEGLGLALSELFKLAEKRVRAPAKRKSQ